MGANAESTMCAVVKFSVLTVDIVVRLSHEEILVRYGKANMRKETAIKSTG